MALVSSGFAERYAELTSRVPTTTERLLDVQRNEYCDRRKVEAQAAAAFQDVLHIAAIMIADKKAHQHGANTLLDQHALTLYKQETAVWFPAAPPRTVPFRANRPLRAFPHAAFAELCDEERELRQWLYGVERHLRQHIEEAGSRSFFYLDVMADTVAREHRGRQRLQKEEDDAYTELKQRFFRTVPADYFRHLVIARYGSSVPVRDAADDEEDTSLEAQEAKARAALANAEEQARRDVFEYLQTAYAVRLFSLNHTEVMQRYELEQAEANELYPLIAGLCRSAFGGSFYHVPAVALHAGAGCACLRALCLAQVQKPAAPPSAAERDEKPEEEDVPGQVAAAVDMDAEELGPEGEDEQPMYPGSAAASTMGTPPPPADEDTRAAMPSPSAEVDPLEELGREGEENGENASAAAEKKKEWEVNTDPTPAVHTTLYAFEDSMPILLTTVAADSSATPAPAAGGEDDDETNEAFAATAAPATDAGADAVVTLSHNNSELTCSPQPLPNSIFSTEEIFVGDPFADSPKKNKKAKKAKKAKKSSKTKRSKSHDMTEE